MVYIVDEGGENDRKRLPLTTKRGRTVPNAVRIPRSPASMADAIKVHMRDGRMLRSASSEYNCVGLVFGSRRTVIDIREVLWILEDDGYRRIPQQQVMIGDLLLYDDAHNEPAHIGVVWQHEADLEHAAWRTKILSQWGADGEYLHDAADVPRPLGQPRQFFTERVNV